MTSRIARALPLRDPLSRLLRRFRHGLPAGKPTPPARDWIELAARIGYAAQGFIYISLGLMLLLAAGDLTGTSVSSLGVIQVIAKQPFGRVWLILLGLGLIAFVMWRLLQSVFDADRAGRGWRALGLRSGQFVGALIYGALAFSVFRFLDRLHRTSPSEETDQARDVARLLLDLPFGRWMLLAAGLIILAVGASNVVTGIRRDFASTLHCDEETCRRVVPVARAGYVGWGLAYLPLGVFVLLGGLRTSASEVLSFADSLNALERQPGGPVVLGLTAVGVMAFGAFALVEARYRKIRPPKDLSVT